MNARLEWWLTSHRGTAALDAPLWLVGIGLAIGYQALRQPHFSFVFLLVMLLPMCIKMLVAWWMVGWRKAAIPQDMQDSTFSSA
jgi:hypothetical protein